MSTGPAGWRRDALGARLFSQTVWRCQVGRGWIRLPVMTKRQSSGFRAAPRSPPLGLGTVCAYALLGLWTLVCLCPLYWVAITSLKSEAAINDGPYYVPFIDFTPSFAAWAFILSDPYDNLLRRFANSAIIALTSTVLTVLLGALAVYGLTRFRYVLPWTGPAPRNRAILIAMLATRLLPPIVVVLPLYLMAQWTGTLDTQMALIAVYTGANLPVAIFLLQPVLGTSATEQEEAALLDGASRLGIFWTILLPMTRAGFAAVGLMVFVLCWNEYLFAAYLAGDQAMTLPPWMAGQLSIKEAQVGGEAAEIAQLSAAAVLMALPVLAFTGLLQRFVGNTAHWQR